MLDGDRCLTRALPSSTRGSKRGDRRRCASGRRCAARTRLAALGRARGRVHAALARARARCAICPRRSPMSKARSRSNPNDARAWNELGILCVDDRQHDRAIDAFTRATALDPRYARAWNNLGNALRDAGRLEEARSAFARATQADPRYALAWANLGVALRDLGTTMPRPPVRSCARLHSTRSTRLALTALAGLARAEGNLDEAVALYQRALALEPRDATTWLLLRGDARGARRSRRGASRLTTKRRRRDRRLLRAVFGRHLTLPMVPAERAGRDGARARHSIAGSPQSKREVPARAAASRREYGRRRAALDQLPARLPGRGRPRAAGAFCRRRLRARSTLSIRRCARRCPDVTGRSAGCASASSRRSFATARSAAISSTGSPIFPRDAFEVLRLRLAAGPRSRGRAARGARGPLPALSALRGRRRLRPQIRDDAPDVLVYPELGMDATTFAIAALRLAPLQCAAWGHPVTTGHPTIDVFFTSERHGARGRGRALHRAAGAAAGHRHALCTAGAAAERIDRDALGLPRDVPLFLCPQSLFKIAPDNDALFARVLAAIPDARLVVFEGRHPQLTAKYRARVEAACAAAGVVRPIASIVRPQCAHDDYLRINARATRCSTRCAGRAATRASTRSRAGCRS